MTNPQLSASAKEIVLVANTPTFLLRQMQRDPALQYIVQSRSPEQMYQELAQLIEADGKADALVAQYIYLVALGTVNCPEVWAKVKALNLKRLQWGDALVAMIDVAKQSSYQGPQPGTYAWTPSTAVNVIGS